MPKAKKFPPPFKSTEPQPKRKGTNTEPNFKDVMVDLETVGQRPGCGILSIGAVQFDPNSSCLGEEFYQVVNLKSCEQAGLTADQSTLDWWEGQSVEAKQVLIDAQCDPTEGFGDLPNVPLTNALTNFTAWLSMIGLSQVRVWGNGSDFDNAILAVAYAAVGDELPWKFWNNRCYRTLKSLMPGPKVQRQGTYHNALDDAKTQALHAIQLLR